MGKDEKRVCMYVYVRMCMFSMYALLGRQITWKGERERTTREHPSRQLSSHTNDRMERVRERERVVCDTEWHNKKYNLKLLRKCNKPYLQNESKFCIRALCNERAKEERDIWLPRNESSYDNCNLICTPSPSRFSFSLRPSISTQTPPR